MVVSTFDRQVLSEGRSVVDPFEDMVEVADGGRSGAAGCDAGFVSGSDERGFDGVGSAFGDAVVEQVAVFVDDGVSPLLVLLEGDLAGLSGVSLSTTSMSPTKRHRCSYGSL